MFNPKWLELFINEFLESCFCKGITEDEIIFNEMQGYGLTI